MTIRLFTKNDLLHLIAIENLTQDFPWQEDVFTQCFNSGYLGWVLEQENQVIGFVMLSFQIGECHILNIAIHPVYQRLGLGHQLLLEVLKQIKQKGANVVFLEVRRSNTIAISLYNKMGFVEIGVRNGYYPAKKNREDAIVFAKDLGVDDSLSNPI
jgi:ribosomal-protein-alanine N-acetyltransferase